MHEPLEILTTPASVAPEAPEDRQLLLDYASTGSESAFSQLVNRHLNFVYSAAFRQTGNHAMAQDIAQAVFTILARKAASLQRQTILAGWLFRAVRYAALDAHKISARRQAREQEASQMIWADSTHDAESHWDQFAPLLDEALAALNAKDRHAVLLRFFEKKSFDEIGSAIGGNENSARVRVVRAVEKLRSFFHRRGVTVSASVLMSALLVNAVQAAPPSLAPVLIERLAGEHLIQPIVRRLALRHARQVAVILLLLFLMGGALTLFNRQHRAAHSAALADAARSVRELMIAIDRTYTLNDPTGFVAIVQLPGPNAKQSEFAAALADYVRAQSQFRQEMQRAFNVRQRTFDATFSELCTWKPASLGSYIQPDTVVTNIMSAHYPVRLVKVANDWKWDLFADLSADAREKRLIVLRQKTVLLDTLASQIHDRTATNVTAILAELRGK